MCPVSLLVSIKSPGPSGACVGPIGTGGHDSGTVHHVLDGIGTLAGHFTCQLSRGKSEIGDVVQFPRETWSDFLRKCGPVSLGTLFYLPWQMKSDFLGKCGPFISGNVGQISSGNVAR